MNQKDSLTPYVTSQLERGTPAETIKQQLTEKGWNAALVDEVITDVSRSMQTPQPSTPGIPTVENATQPAQTPANAQFQASPQAAASPADYSLVAALKDAFNALKTNALALTIISVLGMVLTVVLVMTVILGGIAAFFGTVMVNSSLDRENFSFVKVVLQALPWIIGGMLVISLGSTFVQAVTGLAINDGASGKKSDIKSVVVMGAKRTIRLFLANILYSLILLVPSFILLALALTIGMAASSLMWIIFLLGIVVIIATVLIAIRLILMPFVALLEPTVPLSKLYSRTRHLMDDGGTLFMIKCMGVVFVLILITSVIFPQGKSTDEFLTPISIISVIVQTFIYLFYSAVLIVFYRNRKAVKG